MKDLRESEKGILVLDSGDLLFKRFFNPLPENELKGISEKAYLIIESLNLIGYDAIGIGEDDLTLGKDFLVEISKKANFPFLSSNLFDEASGNTLFRSSIIKEVNGFRIGIFSLLSPEFFTGPSEPRKKGLMIRPPIEVAQEMVKDIEVAQTVPGIHIIVGGHTGINLPYPPVIKNIVILQTTSRGMFIGRLDLVFNNHEPIFYNSATKISLENSLNQINQRLNAKETPEAERAQWRKSKEEAERTLTQLHSRITSFPFRIR